MPVVQGTLSIEVWADSRTMGRVVDVHLTGSDNRPPDTCGPPRSRALQGIYRDHDGAKAGFDMTFWAYTSASSAHRSTGVFAYLTKLSGS